MTGLGKLASWLLDKAAQMGAPGVGSTNAPGGGSAGPPPLVRPPKATMLRPANATQRPGMSAPNVQQPQANPVNTRV
jgi:hypothetical protein